MHFSTIALFLGLTASSLAAPVTQPSKRAVLTKQSYADFQISDGVGGDALNEVNQKFPVTNLHEAAQNGQILTCTP